jgi:hypothetical protein
VRALETPYQGYLFRSRLEARWALWFDRLGIEFWYEPERVAIPTRNGYLPDFHLPEVGWIEVKGPEPTDEDRMKAYLLSLELAFDDPENLDYSVENAEPVYILYGSIPYPYPKEGNMIAYGANLDLDADPDPEDTYDGISGLCWQQCPVCKRIGIGPVHEVFCKSCLTAITTGVEDRIFQLGAWPWDAEKLTHDLLNPAFFKAGHKSPDLQEAYRAARSARFEDWR